MNETNDTSHEDNQHDASKSPERLEREVDQARDRVGKSMNELSDRFSPGELIDQAVGMAREHGGEFGRNLSVQVKNNPLPLILTSVGISWMMMASSKNGAANAHGSYNTDKHGRSIKDTLGDTATKSRDKAVEVGDRLHGANANVKESAQNARDSLTQFYREQPLIAGSLGIAIGAALGALIPPTDIEDDMLGQASDRSIDAAKSKAENTYDEVRESVR